MVLTNFPPDPILDLPPWQGQRQATFKFLVTNSVTGQNLGEIHPLRTANITHDTSRTIKRQLRIGLGKADVAAINTVQERIRPYMVFPTGVQWPLGVYMFTSDTRAIYTSGDLGDFALSDEMFLVDQQIDHAIGRSDDQKIVIPVTDLLNKALEGLPIKYLVEPSGFTTDQSWGIGTNRGSIVGDLSTTGDWFSPWFDNTGTMRFIRSFEPSQRIPDLDWDSSFVVQRDGITKTNNLLSVADRYIVISNASSAAVDATGSDVQPGSQSISGTYNVPAYYPYSAFNRGFSITSVEQLPVLTPEQAVATAKALSIRDGVYETLNISTAPDPRHDSYNVIKWQQEKWLELSWSLSLVEGSAMQHTLRRAYSSGSP